jgi:hypothetical protein
MRNPGGGRKALEEEYPELPKWIEAIVSEETYGNPEKCVAMDNEVTPQNTRRNSYNP